MSGNQTNDLGCAMAERYIANSLPDYDAFVASLSQQEDGKSKFTSSAYFSRMCSEVHYAYIRVCYIPRVAVFREGVATRGYTSVRGYTLPLLYTGTTTATSINTATSITTAIIIIAVFLLLLALPQLQLLPLPPAFPAIPHATSIT